MNSESRERNVCIPFRSATRGSVACIALAGLLLAGLSHASTIVSLSGSGDLTIEADGAVYLLFSQMELTSLTLTADSVISLGIADYPTSVPTTFDSSAALSGLLGIQSLTFGTEDGDILFDTFVWSGSLAVSASEIYGIGALDVSGDINLDVLEPTGSQDLCPEGTHLADGTSGGGISLGDIDSSYPSCIPDSIVITTGPLGPIVVNAIPEPSASVLFAVGFVFFAGRHRLTSKHAHR